MDLAIEVRQILKRDAKIVCEAEPFTLDLDFIRKYVGRQPAWGPIGFVTYRRTYARGLDTVPERVRVLGRRHSLTEYEEFWLTCVRVVEGCFRLQQQHCIVNRLPWSNKKAQKSAEDMFERMWAFKWLPPGRGLWTMGTERVLDGRAGASAFNCAFCTTANIDADFSGPFAWAMDMSMLGVGVGFDCDGTGKFIVQKPQVDHDEIFVVEDSREGWVNLLRRVLDAYAGHADLPGSIDYSKVRPYGSSIKGFGGTASGPDPLKELIATTHKILGPLISKLITSSAVVDLFNVIGRCVVAGNVRRSALIALGTHSDDAFGELKNYAKNPERQAWGWASNNSIIAEQGMDYAIHAARTAHNGEPGYFWRDNARRYGRMIDPPNDRDWRVGGCNPCQPGWATVRTPDGLRTLADIRVGSIIWSGQRYTKVTNKVMTGIKPVYAYKTRAGVFYGTEQHKVISNGERVEAVEAETIDISAVPTTMSDTFDALDIMDGLVVGDGTVHKASNNLVLLIVGKDDQDYFNDVDVARLLREPRPGFREGYWEIKTTITASELPKTYNRDVPERFWRGDEKKLRGFLRGLYSANGSIVANRITLKASSFAVIERVQQMLSAIGIRSYYTVNAAHYVEFDNGTYESKESYDLNIGTYAGRVLFVNHIGFIQQDKQKRAAATIEDHGPALRGNKDTFEVVERLFMGEEPVYDITVEADEHTYWTGGLLVSNCGEITLEDRELCNICSVYPVTHDSYEDFERTLKMAYLYNKTVTLITTHDSGTNAVMLRNRRIGVSAAGVVQAENKLGHRTLITWLDRGYKYIQRLDTIYSDWLCIPRSIKTTTTKPDGTTALLMGASPGVHFPHAEFYFRVIRFDSGSPIVKAHRDAGYRCEVVEDEPNTTAIYFPVKEPHYRRGKGDVSMWEQLEMAAQIQGYWADNAVSVTVTFRKEEAKDIGNALALYESRLKSVSFLPYVPPAEESAEFTRMGYKHAPYQAVDVRGYTRYADSLKPVKLDAVGHEVTEKFCDGDRCMVPTVKQ